MSVAVIGCIDPQIIGVETISIDDQGVALTGAWDFHTSEKERIEDVIANRYVIAIDEDSVEYLKKLPNPLFNLHDLCSEIQSQALLIENEFNIFVKEKGEKKQKLVAPNLRSVEIPDQMNNVDIIKSMIQDKSHVGLDARFSRIILAAWSLRTLVEIWQHNESERVTRRYLNISTSPFQILPGRFIGI